MGMSGAGTFSGSAAGAGEGSVAGAGVSSAIFKHIRLLRKGMKVANRKHFYPAAVFMDKPYLCARGK